MYNHAPADYECPFCALQHDPDSGPWHRNRRDLVFEEGSVYCLLPLHYWGVTKGNVLIIPKTHYENLYDLDEAVGTDLIRASQLAALAMKRAFACDGVSTRQHNEPAGNQDVWHYHLHVFPRYQGDGLYKAPKERYEADERTALADQLKEAVAAIRSERGE